MSVCVFVYWLISDAYFGDLGFIWSLDWSWQVGLVSQRGWGFNYSAYIQLHNQPQRQAEAPGEEMLIRTNSTWCVCVCVWYNKASVASVVNVIKVLMSYSSCTMQEREEDEWPQHLMLKIIGLLVVRTVFVIGWGRGGWGGVRNVFPFV